MIHAIVQILKVDEAMSMEYKIDVDGCLVSGSKSIETIEDYEKFKKELHKKINSLDKYFRYHFNKKKNGREVNHSTDMRKAESELISV